MDNKPKKLHSLCEKNVGVFSFGSFGLTYKPNWFCSVSYVARGADIVAGVTLVMPLVAIYIQI
jgi:hypothetical protein